MPLYGPDIIDPTKFFGCELGAQVKCDDKTDRYIVNGAHDAPKLQQILDGFISKFVLCAECLNPETDLLIQKDGSIIRDCQACGKRTAVDMTHKLSSFIVKNPPEQSAGEHYQKAKGGKKKGKKGSSENLAEQSDEDGQDGEQGSDDEMTRRIDAEVAELAASNKVKSALDDWAGDTSEDAVLRRQQEMGGLSDALARKLNVADEEGMSWLIHQPKM